MVEPDLAADIAVRTIIDRRRRHDDAREEAVVMVVVMMVITVVVMILRELQQRTRLLRLREIVGDEHRAGVVDWLEQLGIRLRRRQGCGRRSGLRRADHA